MRRCGRSERRVQTWTSQSVLVAVKLTSTGKKTLLSHAGTTNSIVPLQNHTNKYKFWYTLCTDPEIRNCS